MSKIYDLPSPSGNERFTYLILSDIHSLHSDPVAVKKAIEYFNYVPAKQRKIILLGDILDVGFIYAKCPIFQAAIKMKDWDYFLEEVLKEKVWFDEFYQLIRPLVVNDHDIYYSAGNHEQRVERDLFLPKIPHALRHNFEIRNIISSSKRSMLSIDYNDWFRITTKKDVPLYLTHGQFCGQNPIKKHFLTSLGGGGAIVFGHTHEIGMMSFSNVGHTIVGVNNPCLCGIDSETQPKYLEGRSNNWSQGFTLVTVTENYHHFSLQIIKNGELCLSTGELI